MKQTDLFQMNTLVRVRETTLLSAQQRSALLHAPDEGTTVKLLSEGGFFSFAAPAEEYDRMLTEETAGWLRWADEIAPGTGVPELFMLSDTVHTLKVILKEHLTGKELSSLYAAGSLYPAEELRTLLADDNKQSTLPERWREVTHQALEDYALHASLGRIDQRLDAFYYEELTRRAEATSDPDIRAITAAMADLYHLSMLLQSRVDNEPVPAIAIVKDNRIGEALPGLLAMPAREQDAFMRTSEYAPMWERLSQNKEPALFDVYADEYLMTSCKKAKLQAFGIFPLYAFLYAKLRDIKNVRVILTGKRQHWPEKEIEKRVCGAYEL